MVSFGISLTTLWLMIWLAHPYRKYRKLLIESGIGVRKPRQVIRILALLVESGMIYILIGVSSTLVYKHRLSRLFPSGRELGLYHHLPEFQRPKYFQLIHVRGHTACSA